MRAAQLNDDQCFKGVLTRDQGIGYFARCLDDVGARAASAMWHVNQGRQFSIVSSSESIVHALIVARADDSSSNTAAVRYRCVRSICRALHVAFIDDTYMAYMAYIFVAAAAWRGRASPACGRNVVGASGQQQYLGNQIAVDACYIYVFSFEHLFKHLLNLL